METFGGNIPVIHISAKFGKNLDLLQDLILFEAELKNLREDNEGDAEGIVIEARKDITGDSKACTVIV